MEIDKKFIFAILTILLLGIVSSIRINEIEINPQDDCNDCTEWAELYSGEEINLSEYYLENNKGSSINLSETGEGYIFVEFGKRFLTNTGDKLILKKNGEIIHETSILKDEKNDDLTWQFCDDEWNFYESTKEEGNECEVESEESESENSDKETEDDEDDSEEEENEKETKTENSEKIEFSDDETTETINLKPIVLNTQNIKSENDKEFSVKDLAFYGVIFFGVVFGALFFLNKRKYKNEFQ